MARSLRQPDLVSFDGNTPENLRIFLMEFDMYVAAAHPKATGETQGNILLNLDGREAIPRSHNFLFASDADRQDSSVIKDNFSDFCTPLKNLIILRHTFKKRSQKADESFQAYLTALRTMPEACEFGYVWDELLKDRIVVGIRNDKTRDVLFAEPKLKFR